MSWRGVERRPSSAQRGYSDAAWRRLRAVVLARDRWCVLCLLEARHVPAVVADHDPPKRTYPLHLQASSEPNGARHPSALRGLCRSCHARKKADKARRRER